MIRIRARTELGSSRRRAAAFIAVGLLGVAGCSSGGGGAPSTPPPASSAAAAPSGAPTPGLAEPYRSPDGYTINPPAGWVFHPTDGQGGISSVFAAPTPDTSARNPFVDNINVVITPTTDNLETEVAKAKQQAPSVLPNYQVGAEQPTTLASGQPAYVLGGSYDDEKAGQLKNLQLLAVNNGKAYTVTYTASSGGFPDYLEAAEASLTSFALN